MLPPPKGGGFVVTDSSPVPSQARLKVSPPEVGSKSSHPRWAHSPRAPHESLPGLAPPGSRWIPPPPRPSRSRCCSRSTPAPPGAGPRTASATARIRATAYTPSVLPFLSAGPQGFHGPTALFGPCSHLKTEEP